MEGIKPLSRYACPAYPTIDEIGAADLSRPPARWARLKAVVASLGTVAMTMRAFAQDAVPSAPTTVAPTPKTVKDKPAEAAAQTVTDVCPLLPVAVAGEGRGGFGCVAVNPPVMLSEGEALEIIEREFAKRGIALRDCPELDGVDLPSRPNGRRKVMFDFGNEQGDVLVEYVSADDVDLWKEPSECLVHSTARCYDMREAATNAVAALSKRTTGRPVTVGVLYDPLVRPPDDSGDRPKEKSDGSLDVTDYMARRRARREAGRALSEKRLKAQLEGFFAHLAKRGKLGAASLPPSP